MNTQLISLELAVSALALVILLLDLWTPVAQKARLGYVAVAGVVCILAASFFVRRDVLLAFDGMYVFDDLAFFFKVFFLIAAVVVLLMSIEFSERIESGIAEFYALILFSLAGMMFAASANDFILVFVSLELITVSFYILTSFQRRRLISLEAGIKYLILGALSSSFLVFGIAFIFGTTNNTNFTVISGLAEVGANKMFLVGVALVLVGLGFKIAAFPFQMWAPDVYEGAPVPVTAFLAIGSKAAGFALLVRVLFSAVPFISIRWSHLLVFISAATILYGNLCAIPQRNLKRLLGYSSIANAGYLLMGVAALNEAGLAAIQFYLAGYLFTVLAAFYVICLVTRHAETEDVSVLAGLGHRSPVLAATLSVAMVSLAGIPPMAGFFGKFLLLRAVVEKGAADPAYLWLAIVALIGVVISLYYYLGIIRAIYWSGEATDLSPMPLSWWSRAAMAVSVFLIFYLGILPGALFNRTMDSSRSLSKPAEAGLAHVTAPAEKKIP